MADGSSAAWLLVPHGEQAGFEAVAAAPLRVVRYSGPPPMFLPFERPQPLEQVEPGAEGVGVEVLLLQQLAMGGGHG
jgi:hypothetical protein